MGAAKEVHTMSFGQYCVNRTVRFSSIMYISYFYKLVLIKINKHFGLHSKAIVIQRLSSVMMAFE